jgi:hypothetical protein
MSRESYLPHEDDACLRWMQAFRNHIVADPPRYGLTPADGAGIKAVVDGYESAYAIAIDEATRTKGTIIDKNDAKATAEHLCRRYAIRIKNNAGVADSDKVDIGVRPINLGRNPVDPPSTVPLLQIMGVTQGRHELRYADSATPSRKSKPYGAIGMELYMAVGDEEPPDVSGAAMQGLHTRNPVTVPFTGPDAGKLATYFARWVNTKGEPGPWSTPVKMRIAA